MAVNNESLIVVTLEEDDQLFNVTSESSEFDAATPSVGYTVFVPLFFGACIVTFLMNVIIIASFPFIRSLSRVRKKFVFTWSEKRFFETGSCMRVYEVNILLHSASKSDVFAPPLAHFTTI
jgi:hypothetical protein